MRNSKMLCTLIMCVVAGLKSHSQINYSGKIELGYIIFKHQLIDVDPGPNYRGAHLNTGQSGKEISSSNGISIQDAFYTA